TRFTQGKYSLISSKIRVKRLTDSVIASPSAKNTFSKRGPNAAAFCNSSIMYSSSLGLNFFCDCVYISQKVQLFQEQPLETCKIKDLPSLGGRNTGSI